MSNKFNLIICITPLQMLIAEKIIELHNDIKWISVCISYDANDKYSYYYEKIKIKSYRSYWYYVKSESKIGRLFDVIKFNRSILSNLNEKFDSVFFASIDNPFIQLSLSKLKYEFANSFDDGAANVWSESIYNKPVERSIIQKAIYSIVGIQFNEKSVKNLVCTHYTIFPKSTYLLDKSKFISLISDSIEIKNKNEKIRIFLGQPLREYNYGFFDSKNLLALISEFNITYYFRHPREKENYNFVEYIDTEKIFEDYIVELLDQGYEVEVFCFFSSAALTVVGLQNVKVYSLFDNLVFNRFSELFVQFKENGVNLINMDHRNEN